MTTNIPALVAPSSRTWPGIGREAATGTPVLPTNTIPLEKSSYEPEDTPKFLEDLAIRGSMSHRFATILGVEDATFSYGGPFFVDTYPFFLDNVLGDLSTVGSNPTSATTTTEVLAVGSTATTVSSIVGYSSGTIVQIDSGAVAEVVVLSAAPSGSTLNFAKNPLRFAHTSGAAVSVVSAPFTHVFAVLNQTAGVGGINGAQAPTHSITDFTGLTQTVGARTYPSVRAGQLDITGNTEGLLMGKVSGNSWQSAPAVSAPTNSTTFTVPVAAWQTTVTIGGTPVYSSADYSISAKRELAVYWTAQDSQSPYIIAQGDLDFSGSLKFTVPSDESPLLYMLNNTQPTLSIATTNGVSGAGLESVTFAAASCAFVKAKTNRSGVLVGYDDEWHTNANTTNVGGSGGLGQATLTVINAVPTY